MSFSPSIFFQVNIKQHLPSKGDEATKIICAQKGESSQNYSIFITRDLFLFAEIVGRNGACISRTIARLINRGVLGRG